MMKSPNWLSKILKEETVTSTNDRLAELCQEKEIKEFNIYNVNLIRSL